MARTGYILRRR